MGCAIPLRKQMRRQIFFFSLSGAGLNSSEAINVLTSQDCFDMSLHSFETNKHPQGLPTIEKSWGVSVQRTFRLRLQFSP